MGESVYKVIELVGTSSESWEKATAAAVQRAAQSVRDLRIAEVTELDVQITDIPMATLRMIGDHSTRAGFGGWSRIGTVLGSPSRHCTFERNATLSSES